MTIERKISYILPVTSQLLITQGDYRLPEISQWKAVPREYNFIGRLFTDVGKSVYITSKICLILNDILEEKPNSFLSRHFPAARDCKSETLSVHPNYWVNPELYEHL
jgi:hypothetical protein